MKITQNNFINQKHSSISSPNNLNNDKLNQKVIKSAEELGINTVFLEKLKTMDYFTFEILATNDETGEISTNCIIKKGQSSKSFPLKIKGFNTVAKQNLIDVDKYYQQVLSKYSTKFQTLMPLWEKNRIVTIEELGIILPLNINNLTIDLKIKSNLKNGIVTLDITISKGSVTKNKEIEIYNFKTLDQQNGEEVMNVKNEFLKLGDVNTTWKRKLVDDFVQKNYLKTELGFEHEPKNLNGVEILSYEVSSIDQKGFLTIKANLKKGNYSDFVYFKLNGFWTSQKQDYEDYLKIFRDLNNFNKQKPFNLNFEIGTENSWGNVWELISKYLITKKNYSQLLINKIAFIPLDKNQQHEQLYKILNDFTNGLTSINKSFKILTNHAHSFTVTLYFEKFLSDQYLLKDIETKLKNDSIDQSIIELELNETSKWKNITVEQFAIENNFISSTNLVKKTDNFILWKDFLKFDVKLKNLQNISKLVNFLEFKVHFSTQGKCNFIFHFFKNHAYKKISFITLKGFKI